MLCDKTALCLARIEKIRKRYLLKYRFCMTSLLPSFDLPILHALTGSPLVNTRNRIEAIVKERGEHEGLVHIFSALELNKTYTPWHDKAKGTTYFKKDKTKCLTYYFYFIDREFGLCFIRVPTIAPFKVDFYFNEYGIIAVFNKQVYFC